MAELPRIKCSIPQSWQTDLESLARQTGQSVEQVVYQAIAQHLGKHLDKKQDLYAEYAEDDIEDEPDEILVGFLESDDFQDRLQQAIDPTVSSTSASRQENEEYEDESGEVLYDFIEP
ncbi:MAG: hypothetical protein KME15_25055 [Drouetiella hepatica Uher 2000/2452]|jgi:hypothetical protein|uniref:Uncharacterized protein n=1 Tax=Drouetiella hepatica Uher 2000/2452 TaxID=904376 RepID=A0A951QEV2_9CYAN|nr:hypothetical protein [Drouetiella hepatica Uher 2000/2452]